MMQWSSPGRSPRRSDVSATNAKRDTQVPHNTRSDLGTLVGVLIALAILAGHASHSPAAPPETFTPATVVAMVNNQPILAGDILGEANQALAPHEDRMSDTELQAQREALIKKLLDLVIERKLFYAEFLKLVPKEGLANIETKIDEKFESDEKEGLLAMMQRAGVSTPQQLDAHYRALGSSLAKQRRAYGEQFLAQLLISRSVDYQPEVTHEELWNHYVQNDEKYAIAARAQWEGLTAALRDYPTPGAAENAVAQMGNSVLRGAPLAEVAKRRGSGAFAADGGWHDWTSRGSLASEVLDEAIFTLPLGRLSQILRDEEGFHIIRVVRREEAGRVPFREAQVEIKESLRKEKVMAQIQELANRLKQETHVWSIFDDAALAARFTEAVHRAARGTR